MAFEPRVLKQLQDRVGEDVAAELDRLHEEVFPTKKVADKSEDDDTK